MGLLDFLFGKSSTEHEHRHKRRRSWQTKCHNCGHNVIRRHDRWWHKSYNPGLQPGEDGDDPNEFGYVEYTSRCKYGSCRCTRPIFRRGS